MTSEEVRRTGEDIINGMVNHNRAPTLHEDRFNFEADYDWTDCDRVLRVVQQAVDAVEELWPVLVEHLEDQRYCISCAVGEKPRNFTVGKICQNIISNALSEAYIPCGPKGKGVFHRLYMPDVARGDAAALKAWCKERSGKKLYELQIEMCEWAISTVAELKQISEEQRSKSIGEIKGQIAVLRESKRAFKPKSITARVRTHWFFFRADGSPSHGDSENRED